MILDIKKLNKLVDDKLISVQKHPETDLFIYNYTEKAQFDHIWTKETLMCRGLIVDGKGKIIARPFSKFFNLDELSSPYVPQIDLKQPFKVLEKLDGSLGILYFLNDMPFIATRGSFASEQAIEATKILRYKYFDVEFKKDRTYLFEIIYPENRIVVNYGDTKDLFLLTAINNETGKDVEPEYSHKNIGPKNFFPKPKEYDYTNIEEISEMMGKPKDNDEGFVIMFKDGNRAKLKYEEYKRLHKLLTGVNARRIWEVLKEGGDMQDLCKAVPDEFYNWVQKASREIKLNYRKIEKDALKAIADIGVKDSRKEYAQEFLKYPKLSAIMFKIIDGKPYKELIWKLIKPEAEKPFYQNKEEV